MIKNTKKILTSLGLGAMSIGAIAGSAVALSSCKTTDNNKEMPAKYFDIQDGVLMGIKPEYAKNIKDYNSIKLPSGVTEIAKGAFKGVEFASGGVSIEMPETVKYVGEEAFFEAYNLFILDFSNCPLLEEIGARAFYDCRLLYVNLQATESLEEIGDMAFARSALVPGFDLHRLLVDCDITSGRIALGENLFLNASTDLMLEVYATDTEDEIADAREVLVDTETEYVGFAQDLLGDNARDILTGLKLQGITYIGTYAFYNFYNLSDLDFSTLTTVNTIGDYAFAKLYKQGLNPSLDKGIKAVDLSKNTNLRKVGVGAFSDCSLLTDISIVIDYKEDEELKPVEYGEAGEYGVFEKCGPTIIFDVWGVDELNSEIDDSSVSDVDPLVATEGGFVAKLFGEDKIKLTTVSINKIITIGTYAFAYCENLIWVEVDQGIVNFNDRCFYKCHNLSFGLGEMFGKDELDYEDTLLTSQYTVPFVSAKYEESIEWTIVDSKGNEVSDLIMTIACPVITDTGKALLTIPAGKLVALTALINTVNEGNNEFTIIATIPEIGFRTTMVVTINIE